MKEFSPFLYPEEVEDLFQRAYRGCDPRLKKLRDYRSGGHRFWMDRAGRDHSGHPRWKPRGISDRVYKSRWQNYYQRLVNRQIRHASVLDEFEEGIVPPTRKWVDWEMW
jgi:hypothetical protein